MSAKSKRILLTLPVLVSIIAASWISGCFDTEEGDDPQREEGGPWKDLKDMKKAISGVTIFNYGEVTGPGDLNGITNPENTVYLLIGLEKNITTSDHNSIKSFIKKGGMVIVADDGTRANRLSDLPLLEGVDGPDFVGKKYLVDNTLPEKEMGADPGFEFNTSFVKSRSISRGQSFDLVIHEPRGIDNTEDQNIIMRTTKELTVIDMNSNGEMDLGDPDKKESSDQFKPYGAIAVEYAIGENGGGILFVSTTGFFTDNVFNRWDNDDWFKNYLYSILPEGGTVLLDPSKQMYNYSPHLVKIPT